MTIDELDQMIETIVRMVGILIIVFNLGIVMILFRQISIMNRVIKVEKHEVVIMMLLTLLVFIGIALLYSLM